VPPVVLQFQIGTTKLINDEKAKSGFLLPKRCGFIFPRKALVKSNEDLTSAT